MTPLQRIEKKLAELREMEAMATPGRWDIDRERNDKENEEDSKEFDDWSIWSWKNPETKRIDEDELAWETDGGCNGYGLSKADAEFCSGSRTAVPQLIKALEIALLQRDHFIRVAYTELKKDYEFELEYSNSKIADALCGENGE